MGWLKREDEAWKRPYPLLLTGWCICSDSAPAGVNAVYRGFNGPTCEIARNSAVRGSGTDKGSQFKEVTYVLSEKPRQCIVQGWAWTTSKTGSSRQ